MDFDNLHQVLRNLYQEMMPLCGDMIGVAKGIAGLGALFYVAYRVWKALANAEPIDVFPLLRPFAIGLCVMFFPTVVLGTINAVMSPVVQGTHAILEGQTLDLDVYKRQVRGDPRRLVQGPEGLARIQRGTQAGLVHPRALPPGHGRGGHEFPLPQLRAAFQRASVPDPRLLPLPDENDEGAYAHAFRLLDPLPGQHHSQRGKPGIGDKIPGGGGTVRALSLIHI